MPTLKIAFLLTQSLESPSGLGRFGPMARELANRGHQVEVFALHPDFASLQKRRILSGRAAVNYVAQMHVQKKGNSKSYYAPTKLMGVSAQATWQLTRHALASNADIIHICKPHPMNGLAGLFSQFYGRKQVLVDCDDFEAGLGNFQNGYQKKIVASFERYIPRHVTAVTTNTHFMEQNLISWGVPAERITHIPNGYEPGRFKKPTPEQLAVTRAKLGINGKRVISYIGTIGFTSHPVYLLLEAFAKIQATAEDAILLLAGGGEDIDRLENLSNNLGIAEKVIIAGRIPPEDISLYYSISDVTVDPVHDDDVARGRSPLKLFESWASGVPVVTSAVGDRAALIGQPPAGILAVPGDSASLANCIIHILKNPEAAQEFSRRGLEKAAFYSWDRLVIDLEDLYFQVREQA